jgi:hypothetical protein
MTQLRGSDSRDPCFGRRIADNFGGDHKMLRTVLVAKPEVMLTGS